MWSLIVVTLLIGGSYLVQSASASENRSCTVATKRLSDSFNDPDRTEVFLFKSIVKLATQHNVNSQCFNEIKELWHGMEHNEIWAIKALDASGNYKSGFMTGNNQWEGSKVLCDNLKRPMWINYSKKFHRAMKTDLLLATSPFDFNYKVVYVQHQSSYQFQMKFLAEMILHIGLCTPSSCSNEEIANLTAIYFRKNADDLGKTFQFQGEVLHAKTLELEKGFYSKVGVRLARALLVVTIALTVLSYFVNRSPHSAKVEPTENCVNHNNNSEALHNGNSHNGHIKSSGKDTQATSSSHLMLYKILNCFSISENAEAVWSKHEPPNSISVINGIRSIGCNEILCFHMNWFMFFTSNNPAMFFFYAERLALSPIANAPLLVDAFFAISGFLHAYNYLRNEKLQQTVARNGIKENAKLIGRLVLNRYIRLSVLNFIVVLFTEVGTSYLTSTSPYWIYERNDVMCQKYWWRNVLYIQNLFNSDVLCVPWSWSLACEMQYYIIFTVGLFLYTKKPAVLKRLFGGFALLISVISFVITVNYKFQVTFDLLFETGTSLYIAPWSRIHPYISGTFTGWLICTYNIRSLIPQDKTKWLRYGAVSIILGSIFATFNRGMSWIIQSLLLLLVRFAFGFAVSVLVVLNIWREKSTLMSFLSSRIFVHINKISFAIYLLNPLAITMFYGLRDHSSHIEPAMYVHETVGMMVIVYLLSFAFTVFFEMPYTKLLTILAKKL